MPPFTAALPTALDVVTFGEAMLLLVADRPGRLEDVSAFLKRSAGAETNVAIGLARLRLKVGWASRLGADSMARYLLGAMQRESVADAVTRGAWIGTRAVQGLGDTDGLPTCEQLRAAAL